MTNILLAATTELQLLQIELEALKTGFDESEADELLKTAYHLRISMLEIGQLFYENVIERQLNNASIEDILQIDNHGNEVIK